MYLSKHSGIYRFCILHKTTSQKVFIAIHLVTHIIKKAIFSQRLERGKNWRWFPRSLMSNEEQNEGDIQNEQMTSLDAINNEMTQICCLLYKATSQKLFIAIYWGTHG